LIVSETGPRFKDAALRPLGPLGPPEPPGRSAADAGGRRGLLRRPAFRAAF
jgi:hypothetical protein